ncbi:MAG TPA: DUF2461 family protein, partial [Chiayiivirga sp.]|nr:DUF2461 family protein [Chiayiivirga sp.]
MSPRADTSGTHAVADDYFSARSLRFLRRLAANNARPWFQAHRADYETHVREPFLRLVGDLQPALAA